MARLSVARFALAAWLLAAPAALASTGESQAAAGRAESVAAVQKVISMLGDMSVKAKQEKKDEEVAYAKFETWCSMESANLKDDIQKGAEEIELLSASIDKLGSDIKGLGKAIATHQEEKSAHEADLAAEKEQRAKDHAAFLAEEQDYSESVDAIDRALTILSKEDYDRPGASAALLQVSAGRLPAKVKSIVAAFVDMLDGKEDPLGGMEYSAPEANAYEFQSGSIVDLLKKLQDDFRSQLGTTQKEEMNAQHAHGMSTMDHTDFIENTEKSMDEKTKEKGRKASTKALNTKQKAAAMQVKAANEKTLSEMSTECSEKKLSFAEKQQLRAEEIEAIAKAVEILESNDVSGNADKHLAFVQVRRAVANSFLQTASAGQGIHRRIREFLESEGKRLNSKHLTLLAEKLMADPFAKVKSMISAMIKRLLEEANQDAQHEGFCDTELGKNKVTRNKLSEDIDGLQAAIESGKATITELSESTAQLTKEVDELERAMGEATDLRTAEKAKNKETVEDAQAAQKAVAAATAVLKDFYAKASTATALVQVRSAAEAPPARQWGLKTRVKMGTDEWNSLANPDLEGSVDTGHKEGMQTFGQKEEGQQDENNYGVMGLLEIILSDFANLEADTNAAEAAAAEAYERFMVESKRSKATKEQHIELNSADQASAEAKLHEDTADLKATQDELLAADRVYAKLVPQCMDQGMTWEERVAAREAEIASLKEALKLLGMPDIA